MSNHSEDCLIFRPVQFNEVEKNSSGVGVITAADVNWCQKVRSTCTHYMDHLGSNPPVTLCSTALQELAEDIRQQNPSVVWDEEAWHYSPPADMPQRRERIALYILALDAINFCFWPSKCNYEYNNLALSLTAAAEADHEQQQKLEESVSPDYFFAPSNLSKMSVERMSKVLGDDGTDELKAIPLIQERCRLWQEIGTVLTEHFDGSAWNLVQEARGSPVRAVGLLVQYFAGFRDLVCIDNVVNLDHPCFLKRAQICVGDWQAALDLKEWKPELDQLTTFADYRLPQLLRERGVLLYSEELAKHVDEKGEIPSHSAAERSIRASTVVTVERLVETLNIKASEERVETEKSAEPWTAIKVDWYLWQIGERLSEAGKLKPHHRVRTIYY